MGESAADQEVSDEMQLRFIETMDEDSLEVVQGRYIGELEQQVEFYKQLAANNQLMSNKILHRLMRSQAKYSELRDVVLDYRSKLKLLVTKSDEVANEARCLVKSSDILDLLKD